MKKEIANNKYYKIYVDQTINRMYFTFVGEWKRLSQVPNFIKGLEEMMRHLKPGYTSLADTRGMKPPSEEIFPVLTLATEKFVAAGMKKQAMIIDKASMELVRATRGVSKDSGSDEKMMQFSDPVEAENWLDQ